MIKINEIDVYEKDIFRKVIVSEIGPMNPALCKFALEFLDSVSENFWKYSASSSGIHHPAYANEEGGLARHSLMTYRWMMELLETQTKEALDSINEFVPSMVFAALFHDCCKMGTPGNETLHTVFEHPVLAAKFIIDKAEQFVNANRDFIENTVDDEDSFKQNIAVAISCIESHMGKWNTNEKSNINLPIPKSNMQYIVHLSDYIASRKTTLFDYEYFSVMMGR